MQGSNPATIHLAQAFKLAAQLHAIQIPKGFSIPCISRLMSVSALILECGGDEKQAVTALLHDLLNFFALEDLALIHELFGKSEAMIAPYNKRSNMHLDIIPSITLRLAICLFASYIGLNLKSYKSQKWEKIGRLCLSNFQRVSGWGDSKALVEENGSAATQQTGLLQKNQGPLVDTSPVNKRYHMFDQQNGHASHQDVANDEAGHNENIGKECNEPSNKFKVISLFSGCGGMDLGFIGGFTFLGKHYSENPFEIIWANDLNEAACRTYARNIGKHIHPGDIWRLIDNIPCEADLVIGGFPCQDISVNGKGAGVDGKRSGLYRAMVEVVSRVKPKVFVAENVKGLLMKHNADSLERVLSDFKSLGYEVTFQLYHAADYGVPQTRERVIIVGTRPNVPKFQPPAPSHEKSEHITARMAIDDLAKMEENEQLNHIWSRANISAEQGNRRLKADRPGYTIRAECHGNIQFHYELPRRISMREAARFQSFPDSFIFDAKLRETERQVGNAVPPVLAWHIANAIKSCLQ